MAMDKAAAASAAAARQRALEQARQRAAEQARRAAAEKAAQAAKAAAAQQARAKPKGFGKDDMSTGKGGALRRAATSKLAAQGLDPARASTPSGKTFTVSQLKNAADPVSDAERIAKQKNPADRAKALESLVAKNPDPAYRQALLTAAKPSIEELSRQVVDKKSGASTADRQKALDALTRTSEQLDPASQQQLAKTFAGTMKNQNVGDDGDEFGTMLKNSVKDGSGATFGVRLASELQSSGKSTAANDSSKFVGQGIGDVKKSFEEASKKVDELHLHLAQELSTWKLSGVDQTKALAAFSKNNHLDEATKALEKQGALLSSTLNGAATAENDPALKAGAAEKQPAGRGASMARYGNEGDLLEASKGAIANVPALANTRAGAAAISDAVAKGGRSFIDQAKDDIGDVKKGAKALTKLRTAVVQSVGAHLLASAAGGNFEADKAALLKGLESKASLFGTGEKQMKAFTDSLAEFKPGMTQTELTAATKTAGSKISALGSNDSAVSQSLKGLTVVFGAISAVKDWSKFSQADVQQKIATISNTLQVGQQGANLVTSTLSRFASSAAADGAQAEAATIGLTAGKLLGAGVGALATVVSGWQAVNDFQDGRTTAAVGESLTAIGGAVATAGLFLDGTIAGAPAGVVLNIAGGVIAGAGVVVGLFQAPPNPFEGQEKDLGKILQSLGVSQAVADKLKDFNSDGQNFGTWVHAVAQKLNLPTGDFARSMNKWTPAQLNDFLDAARLQHDTDDNNANRRNNASKVLGKANADALEDPTFTDFQTGKAKDKIATLERLREGVDKTTGEITYDDALIASAAQWVRAGLPTG